MATVYVKPDKQHDPDDLTPYTRDFTGPDGKRYRMRELTEAGHLKHQAVLIRAAQDRADGKFTSDPTAVDRALDREPLLTSLCLFELTNDGVEWVEKAVSIDLVKGWPRKLTKRLHAEARQISGEDDGDPIRQALLKALARQDAPVELAALREWVDGFGDEDKDVRAVLAALLAPSAGEQAKN